jgi:hypothetical protein
MGMAVLKFSASKLSSKPAEVYQAARSGGAIIQMKRTNGEVIEEFFLSPCVTTVEGKYETARANNGDLIAAVKNPTEVVGCGFDRVKG